MLHKTRGIVLHVTDYSETSVIAKIYTELFGVQSYLLRGVKKRKAKVRSNILQPMSLLDMEVNHNERGGLQYLTEISNQPAFTNIPVDMMKSSMVLFINEIVYKAVKEEEANPLMFDFLHHAMMWLDAMEPVNADFHLIFMVQFTRFLGFFPEGNSNELLTGNESFFDLIEGRFMLVIPTHNHFMSVELSQWFSIVLKATLQQQEELKIPISGKRELIEKLIEYYGLHLSGFGTMKSHKVLEAVWS